MFTGIIETVGTLSEVQDRDSTRRLWFEAPAIAGDLGLGDSVAVDGACLTVTELRSDAFSVDVIGTTLDRTIAGTYRIGRRVNLGRAARLNARLDGHLVQGHVDGTGRLMQSVKSGEKIAGHKTVAAADRSSSFPKRSAAMTRPAASTVRPAKNAPTGSAIFRNLSQSMTRE